MITFNPKNKKEKEPKGNWFVLVDNNTIGLMFIKRLRTKNPNKAIRLRGRHSNRRHLFNNILNKDYDLVYAAHEVPIKHAERLAVYVYDKKQGWRWGERVTDLIMNNENIKI